jgi:two-component system, NtrC family, nitrogen regulation sensor histidine kinase NtrY
MTELLQSIVTLLENELRAVRIDMPANRYSLIADRALIEQVMINLFKNAASALATASQKAISITVITAPEGMMVIFRDSGTGIPPEILDKIFIPFFTTRKSGSGIGLTISRQIMQRHGGRIEVVSSPGHGTEFRLVFPQRLFH